MSNELRPESFDEYIGQKNVIDNLKVCIESAKTRNSNLDHILLHGSSGIGKTSLAYLVSKVMKKRIIILNGPSLQKPSDIISPLTSIKTNEIIFIDEIHAVNKEILEVLYPALEDNKINIIIGKEYNSKVVEIKLPQFTLIAATTEINRLANPFINRFPINFHLTRYNNEEISKIIEVNTKKLNIKLTKEVCLYLSEFTKLNPRIAINILKRLFDYWIIEKPETLDIKFVKSVMNKLNIYKFGLTQQDVNYLKILHEYKVVGVESINQVMDSTTQTIINNIEPNLIVNKLIKKTFKGRELTEKGIEYLASI